MILCKYGFEPKLGENCQVKLVGNKAADFLFAEMIWEYHPNLWKESLGREQTREEYFAERRALADKSEHKDKPLVCIFDSIRNKRWKVESHIDSIVQQKNKESDDSIE